VGFGDSVGGEGEKGELAKTEKPNFSKPFHLEGAPKGL